MLTTSSPAYTNRGFRVIVDRNQKKLRFVFYFSEADTSNKEISAWLESVKERVGLGPLNPEPYWGFDDLRYKLAQK